MRYLILFFYLELVHAQHHSSMIDLKFQTKADVDVLIELKTKADLSSIENNLSKKEKAQQVFDLLNNHAKLTQTSILKYLKAHQIEHRSYFISNVISATINKEQLDQLESMDEIQYIHYDNSIRLSPVVDKTLIKNQNRSPVLTWGLERIEADKVWAQGFEGQGVTIAGEDTGYNWEIEGIKNKYKGYDEKNKTVDHNYSWHDAIHKASSLSSDSINPCGYSIKIPCDDHGHGTHTAGTMVGSTENELYGVAPKAQWMGCRNMERGNGALSTYIECFEFFLAPTNLDGLNPKPELAPSAINNSWYCSPDEGCDSSNYSLMEEIVDNLRKSGVVVVVSAGNSGQNCGNIAYPPAIFKSTFAIGSFAANDSISGFSSAGPVYNYKDTLIKPDVCAPGSDVLSRTNTGELASWSGTSMAAPHVTGLVALIINANPALDGNVDKIEEIIKLSARPMDANISCVGSSISDRPNHVYGYGKISATEAIRLAIISRTDELNHEHSFFIQPNPVETQLRILDFISKSSYTIYNVNGKKILQIYNPTESIDISNFSSGIYFLQNNLTGNIVRFIKI
ncbi:MAG: S8 family peptidase [Saprospiraceae bacterium]|nr:S8 family peptidase [Saprospiraceae bacterium]